MTKIKNTATVITEYLLMLSIILYSSVWALLTPALSNTFSRVAIIFAALLLVLNFSGLTVRGVKKCCILLLVFAAFLFFTRYNFLRAVLYLIIPFCLFTLYLSSLKGKINRPMLAFSDIMTVITALSVVLYVLGTVLAFIQPTGAVRVWWGEEERVFNNYFHLLYEAQDIELFGNTFIRNCSIFPEAPGFAAYLSLSLAVELFIRNKMSKPRIAILLLGALTSFSAKAILLCALCLLLRFLFSKNRSEKTRALKIGAVIISLSLAAVVIFIKSSSFSFHIRLDDLDACLAAFSQYAPFGAGYFNDSAVVTHFEYAYRANDGLSMGLGVLLCQGGILLFGLYIVAAVLAIINSKSNQRMNMLAFVLVFFGMLFVTNIPFGMITIFIISYFFATEKKR